MNRLATVPVRILRSSKAYNIERCPSGARSIIGGYNTDANETDSQVSGPYGRVPRKVKATEIEGEYQEHAVDDGSAVVRGLDLTGYYSRPSFTPVHKESFAFQEWDVRRTIISRDFLDETEESRIAAIERREENYRHNLNRQLEDKVLKEKGELPEAFHPAPMAIGDHRIARHSAPLLRRNEMRHIPDKVGNPDAAAWERTSEATLRELEHVPRYGKE